MFKNPKLSFLSGLALFLLAIQAYYVANFGFPENANYLAAINVIIFSAPTYWAVKMWLGWRDGFILIAVLAAYAVLIQYAAVIDGSYFGEFDYSGQTGFTSFGPTHLIEASAWPPLMLAAYSVSDNLTSNRNFRAAITALILAAFWVLLDSGSTEPDFYWLLPAMIGSGVFEVVDSRIKPLLAAPVQLATAAMFIFSYWMMQAAYAGMISAAFVGAAVFWGLIVFYRKYYYAFDEMIVLVDEDNNAVGTVRKSQVHDNDTKLHRAFSVFLFNSKGELLLQQRAFSKKTWPGVWSNSCCGHTMLHESSEAAGVRRVGYELGLKNTNLTMALPDFRYRAEKDGVVENEICPVLVGFTDEKPDPNPDEVANIKWVDWAEFLLSLKDPETEISPWAIEEVELLAESEIFKSAYSSNTQTI